MSPEALASEVERITQWPRETWSPEEIRIVAEHRALLHREMFTLANDAEREQRNLTAEEAERFDALQAEFDALA